MTPSSASNTSAHALLKVFAANGIDRVFVVPGESYLGVLDALQAAGLVPEVAEVTMRPENTIDLEGEDAARMQKLLDILEDLDDTQEVYHNAAL